MKAAQPERAEVDIALAVIALDQADVLLASVRLTLTQCLCQRVPLLRLTRRSV